MRNTLTGLTLIAALASGAAIPTSAQKRKPTTRGKQPAAQATQAAPAAVPAPAKKNARSDDATAPQTAVANETPAPVKKNAEARPAAVQSVDPSGAAASAAAGVNYTYEFGQPAFDVRRVVIEHDSAGRGRITFERKNEERPLTEPLDISPSAFARSSGSTAGSRSSSSSSSTSASPASTSPPSRSRCCGGSNSSSTATTSPTRQRSRRSSSISPTTSASRSSRATRRRAC
ncbi:MAG: hypothetical protein LC774_16895 [Acidobacteria bacterium]|nr:hypothetical protein [Acidobacteriota bacterium]